MLSGSFFVVCETPKDAPFTSRSVFAAYLQDSAQTAIVMIRQIVKDSVPSGPRPRSGTRFSDFRTINAFQKLQRMTPFRKVQHYSPQLVQIPCPRQTSHHHITMTHATKPSVVLAYAITKSFHKMITPQQTFN